MQHKWEIPQNYHTCALFDPQKKPGNLMIHLHFTTTSQPFQLSHEKKTPTFHYTGWLIGILIMVYYSPYLEPK